MSQWFPGHMSRAQREVREGVRLVDVILEVVDARIPLASRAANLQRMTAGRPRILVLSKADLAQEAATRQWVAHFAAAGLQAVPVDAVRGKGIPALVQAVETAFAPRQATLAAKQRQPRPARVMVVGIPNVGKSSLLNRLAGGRKAATGNRPGVTRGKQWVRVGAGMDLLDMPGILPPRMLKGRGGTLLVALGTVVEGEYDPREVALAVLPDLVAQAALRARWRAETLPADPLAALEALAGSRGMLRPGGVPDMERAAVVLLQELRDGKLGRVTFERPDPAVATPPAAPEAQEAPGTPEAPAAEVERSDR